MTRDENRPAGAASESQRGDVNSSPMLAVVCDCALDGPAGRAHDWWRDFRYHLPTKPAVVPKIEPNELHADGLLCSVCRMIVGGKSA